MAKSHRQKLRDSKAQRKRKRLTNPTRVSSTQKHNQQEQAEKQPNAQAPEKEQKRSEPYSGGGHLHFMFGLAYQVAAFFLFVVAIGFFFYFLSTRNRVYMVWSGFIAYSFMGLAIAFYLHQYFLSRADSQEPPSYSRFRPVLERPRFKPNTDYVTIIVGGNNHRWRLVDLKAMGFEPFQFRDYIPVRIYVDDDVIYADVKLYAGRSVSPIVVTRNVYDSIPPGWDVNSSPQALEIVNDKQEPMFQLIYRTEMEIEINGLFPYPGGLFILDRTGMMDIPSKYMPPIDHLTKRIFKYPAWKYPGQFAEN